MFYLGCLQHMTGLVKSWPIARQIKDKDKPGWWAERINRLERKTERRKEGMRKMPRASQAVTNQTDMRNNERRKVKGPKAKVDIEKQVNLS